MLMAKMKVRVVKYGYIVIDAETEREAIEKANNMNDSDFNWSHLNDAQVVESNLKIDQIIHEYKERFRF